MPWTIYVIPHEKRSHLEAALKDDLVSRQSHRVREAATLGGPSNSLFVAVEGSLDGVSRAEALLSPLGPKLSTTEAEALHRRFQEEDEAASAGMGLFFTE